jgi:hypothetical protein
MVAGTVHERPATMERFGLSSMAAMAAFGGAPAPGTAPMMVVTVGASPPSDRFGMVVRRRRWARAMAARWHARGSGKTIYRGGKSFLYVAYVYTGRILAQPTWIRRGLEIRRRGDELPKISVRVNPGRVLP